MQSKIVTFFLALRRVQRFLDINNHLLGPVNVSGARLMLDECVARAAEHSVRQHAAIERRKAETLHRRLLIARLRIDHLRPIARVAAAVPGQSAELATLASFNTPGRPSELIRRAQAIARLVGGDMATFVAYGLPSSFITDAVNAAEAIKASLVVDGREQAELARATRGIEQEVARGRRALDVIDALVGPRIANDQRLVETWRVASRRCEAAQREQAQCEQAQAVA